MLDPDRPVRGPLPDEALDALVDRARRGAPGAVAGRGPSWSTRTGLGRAIVAQRVGELLERGLIVEGDVGPSTGGRPPRQLTFRADAGHVLVADLGATSIDVAVTDLDGRILGHHDEPAPIEDGPERCLGRVEELFDALLGTTHAIPGRAVGDRDRRAGPRRVRRPAGPISPPIMPGWDGYPIRERFAARYRAPVWVDNDVNVLALGEWRSGVAAGHDNVVVVKIGTGIGAGIISDGRLHRGAQGSAGDVGHIQVATTRRSSAAAATSAASRRWPGAGRSGGAGSRGGARWAQRAAADRARPARRRSPPRTSRARRRSATRSRWHCSRRPGTASGRCSRASSTSSTRRSIVIGGGVANSPDLLLAAIRETVYRRSLPLATRDLLIQRSSLGGLAGVIGASSMVVDQLFSRDSLARWIEAGDPSGSPDVALARAG